MATIEFIQKRIEGKQKEIDSLSRKLDRICKAKASGWVVNPYYYSKNDEERTYKDLDIARKALKNYEDQLKVETEKAASRNVKAILDFLEMWKDKVRTYYHDSLDRYVSAKPEYDADLKRISAEISENYSDRERYNILMKERRELEKNWESTWKFLRPYLNRNFVETGKGELDCRKPVYTFNDDLFEKDIKREAELKYDDMIERTNTICGTITDATALKIGLKGDLDGYVVGERGKAYIHTIGAGGYNIQCYHFRVLVHEVK